MIFRPATPGFLVTLTATILLALVSFSVPVTKSIYFLRAKVDLNGQSGSATFGVLGYCLNVGGNVNCTSPRVGYEFNPNSLLGDNTVVQIPQILVKWLTYALVLHIVALGFAVLSTAFGLLAHIREFSMACCSTCISGFGASITLVAFIFDVAFFFLSKARINKVPGGSAQIGNAIWLTLVSMLLLLFAGCFYGFGRCCISNRPRGPRDKDKSNPSGAYNGDSEALRLDAVKAEADRKARQKQGEVGLPPFNEYDPRKPLTSRYDGEDEPYTDHHTRQASGYSDMRPEAQGYMPHTGYAPAAPGTSATEAYYNAPTPPQVPSAAPGTSAMEAYYNAPTSPQVPPVVAAYHPQPLTHDQYPSTEYNAYDVANVQPTRGPNPSSGAYEHGQYASNEGAHGHSAQNTSYYPTASQYQQPSHVLEPSSYYAEDYVPPGGSATYASSSIPNTGVESAYKPPVDFLSGTPTLSMGRSDYTFSSTPPPAVPSVSTSSNSARQSPGPRGPRSPTSPTIYGQQISDNPPEYEAGHVLNTAWPNEKKN